MDYTLPQLNQLLNLVQQLKPCPIGMGIVDIEQLINLGIASFQLEDQVAEASRQRSDDLFDIMSLHDNMEILENQLRDAQGDIDSLNEKIHQLEKENSRLENDVYEADYKLRHLKADDA